MQVRTAALGLDVLAVATADETVGTLARRLEEGARRQAVWLAAEATAKDGAVSVPTVYHFRPFAQAPWLPALVLFPFTEPSVEAAHGTSPTPPFSHARTCARTRVLETRLTDRKWTVVGVVVAS